MNECEMSTSQVFVVLLLGIVSMNHPAETYPIYQTRIPNGVSVPNPCDRSTTWPGVGHQSPAGGDERNPFGLDFKNNGLNWTAVCRLDSDGDGRSNGEELGDPGCTWTVGLPSPNVSDITHPGVCEPLDNVNCTTRNSWLTCPDPFDCPAIQRPGVMNMSLTLPVTPVPANETTYMCYGFIFPNDTDHHIIATVPVVSNPVVDHHYLLYVCKDPPGADYFTQPVRCGMAPANCFSIIALWSPGIAGQCLTDEYGFHVGLGGYRYGVLQIHMNNPQHITGMTDSSGFIVYYTHTMRQYDGTVMIVGQEGLEIPPGQPLVTYTGGCFSGCTSTAFNQSIYITAATLHMHLLGSSGHFILQRNGSSEVLVNQTHYDYNAPILMSFDPPYVLHPGDQLFTTCNFDTRSTNKTTYFGEGTSDEMCYVFVTYYPAVDTLPVCTQWLSVNQCFGGKFFDCDTSTFYAIARTVDANNCTATACPPSCRTVMQEIVETRCMDGDMGVYFSNIYGYDYLPPLIDLCGLTNIESASTTATPITSTNSASKPLSDVGIRLLVIIGACALFICQNYFN